MKRFLSVFLFIAAFQMEVRVRAEGPSVSVPDNCVGRSFPCSFKVDSDKWSYEASGVKLHATAKSMLTEVEKGREWNLIEGTLWLENAPSVKIKTFASEAEGSSGQYWVLVEKNRVVYRNISSKLILTFKDQSKIEVPKGFEVWVGGVNSEAAVEHGMVEPIDLKQHLKSWYQLYPGKRSQFISEVQDLKDQWADLIEKSGDMYKRIAERKMAALDDVKNQEVEKKKKQELERKRVRAEFHKRVFEN
ncbi:MAG: hypothetical protein H7326_07835 [Bdellovibrionaceae bacterium]|nr:hypothetical protein [Pseudobdellovibrionaceae bacterium]